jgi:hypothetical protein
MSKEIFKMIKSYSFKLIFLDLLTIYSKDPFSYIFDLKALFFNFKICLRMALLSWFYGICSNVMCFF